MMLHEDVARSVLLTGLWTPLVVALITVAASVAIAAMTARADDLKRAERLSQVLSEMDASPERDLVATLRDDYAVGWALRRAAPVGHGLRRVITVVTVAGSVALFGAVLVGLYVGLGYGTVSDWFFWVYYSVGLILLLGAGWLRRIDARRARVWIRAERARRDLREPLHEGLRREAADGPRRSHQTSRRSGPIRAEGPST
jgi:hypothetical protein